MDKMTTMSKVDIVDLVEISCVHMIIHNIALDRLYLTKIY